MIALLTRARRWSEEKAIRQLCRALESVAGEGTKATFDGERFHLAAPGGPRPVEDLLDAAMDRCL